MKRSCDGYPFLIRFVGGCVSEKAGLELFLSCYSLLSWVRPHYFVISYVAIPLEKVDLFPYQIVVVAVVVDLVI